MTAVTDIQTAARPARESIYTKRPISHDEAREACLRLINSHFRQEPCARISIPAKVDYDDDLVLMAYIKQREEADAVRSS